MSIEVKCTEHVQRAAFRDAGGRVCCVVHDGFESLETVGILRQHPTIAPSGMAGSLRWDATVRVDPKTAVELAVLLTRFARTGSLELVDGDDDEEDAEAEVRRIASRDMRREPEVYP